ncbi:MAG: thioredoxin [Vicinamibacteria bacterium]|nr:thioredoxin [Vicinamibacteria bacterium]
MADKVAHFNDQSWDTDVLGSKQPVLVDFWASWCAPCHAMTPAIEAVAEMYDGRLRVGKLNVEDNPDVPYRYSISALPTLLILKDGRVADQRIGLVSKNELVKIIDSNLE